jgi:predicted lipoprotein with Yx(FWY)xxD motif
MGLKLVGGKKPSIHFEGGSIGGYVLTAPATSDSAMVADANLVVHAVEAGMVGVNSVVQIAALTNGGAGFQATAGSGVAFTIEAVATCDDDAAIIPFAPAPTYTGSPLMGVSGAFTLAAQAFPITAFEFDLDCNPTVCDDHVNTEWPDDLIRNKRKVSGQVAFRVRKDLMRYWMSARGTFATIALLATCGTVAGSRIVTSVPQAELQWSAWSITGDKELTISIPYRGLATAGGNDSFLITQN